MFVKQFPGQSAC